MVPVQFLLFSGYGGAFKDKDYAKNYKDYLEQVNTSEVDEIASYCL